jgi:peptidoglycan/xylan/chitin deacetylase (PgdA/CDA1 family)
MAQDRRVTLTFDNGPEPGVTGMVLDVLAARGVAATFFVIGRKLAAPGGRALAERAHADGHRIGNHTFTHSVPLGLAGPEAAATEITATQELLGDLAPERLFRPYGDQGRLGPHLLSGAARDLLLAGGYTCVLWNTVPRDWLDPDGWPDRALAQIGERDHSLLVLHDLPTGAMRHLPDFLDRLASAGVAITRDFPPDCLAIVNGVPTALCAGCVTG